MTSPTVQERVASAYAEVLGRPVESVAPDSDFFDLGGHSMLATQLVARIDRELGVRVPLRVVFDHPVLADLAGEVERIASR